MKLSYHTRRVSLLLAYMATATRRRNSLIYVVFAAYLTYLGSASSVRTHSFSLGLIIGIVFVVLFACIVSAILFAFSSLVAVYLMGKPGYFCDHEIELTGDGVMESTSVNRSVYFYSRIAPMRKTFGVWIIPVGDNGLLAFFERDLQQGNIAEFKAALDAKLTSKN